MRPQETLEESLKDKSPSPGHHDLSPRELEVAALLALGYSNANIANALNISKRTVKTYFRQIAAKTHVGSKAQIAVYTVAHYSSRPIRFLNGASLLEHIARTQAHAESIVFNGIENGGQDDAAYSQGNPVQGSSAGRQPNFTARELDVLGLMTLEARVIAQKLNILPYTVRAHKRIIFAKLEVTTALEAAFYAAENGINYNAATAATSPAPDINHHPKVSQRQEEVLALLAQGKNNRFIAAKLELSESMVTVHIRNLVDEFGLESRAELAVYWRFTELPSRTASLSSQSL